MANPFTKLSKDDLSAIEEAVQVYYFEDQDSLGSYYGEESAEDLRSVYGEKSYELLRRVEQLHELIIAAQRETNHEFSR